MAKPFSEHLTDAKADVNLPSVDWVHVNRNPKGLFLVEAVGEFKVTYRETDYHYVAALEHDGASGQWRIFDISNRQRSGRYKRYGFLPVAGPRVSWTAIRDAFDGVWNKVQRDLRQKEAVRTYARDVFDDPVTSESKLRRVSFDAAPGGGNEIRSMTPSFDQDIVNYEIQGRGNMRLTDSRLSRGARVVWTLNGTVINFNTDPDADIAFPLRVGDADFLFVATVLSQDSTTTTIYRFRLKRV